MKKYLIIFISILLISAFVFGYKSFFFKSDIKAATIDGQKFSLELAMTPEQHEKGLGGREQLCEQCGMLFIFPQKGIYSFWMKDMQFDLDIVWIYDGKIVYIKKNFSHEDGSTATPEIESDKVLEINAGLADKYGFKVGDLVDLN